MIETTILRYLDDLVSVPVYMEVPENPDPYYVVLEKVGSSIQNHIKSATIAAQSYAPSLAEAASLNEYVKAKIESLTQYPDISAVRLNSDYNFTDTATKQYRYQCLYVITYLED